jgi:hypothetical protein
VCVWVCLCVCVCVCVCVFVCVCHTLAFYKPAPPPELQMVLSLLRSPEDSTNPSITLTETTRVFVATAHIYSYRGLFPPTPLPCNAYLPLKQVSAMGVTMCSVDSSRVLHAKRALERVTLLLQVSSLGNQYASRCPREWCLLSRKRFL